MRSFGPRWCCGYSPSRYNQGNSTDNADVAVPEERERQRTQAIQEELRQRGADQERPRQELDYIGRLLKQF
jgi:hypothetical protein